MTIGDARIRIPDRITRGDLIIVNAIVSHPMDTGFFRDANVLRTHAAFDFEAVTELYGRVALGLDTGGALF